MLLIRTIVSSQHGLVTSLQMLLKDSVAVPSSYRCRLIPDVKFLAAAYLNTITTEEVREQQALLLHSQFLNLHEMREDSVFSSSVIIIFFIF